MRHVIVSIICACAWTGEVPTRGGCPGCGADYTHRLNKGRIAKLREIVDRAPCVVPIEPIMVRWFVDERHRLIAPATGPNPARPQRQIRRPMRAYRLTPAGERVLIAAQLADHQAGLRREIVAESVARHAGLPDA